jgi:hypothetical protein
MGAVTVQRRPRDAEPLRDCGERLVDGRVDRLSRFVRADAAARVRRHERLTARSLAGRSPVAGSENEKAAFPRLFSCGAYRDRTGDLRLAKPTLSQLS